ncbi:unnamed protein product [Porites lobata]|uniref:Uncharacterized protein n=1 Tax=Porites lobata TaxID=104759 RepID=A0ABN8NG38_9CNID|nr:unnamed protein product [Porites lobata]
MQFDIQEPLVVSDDCNSETWRQGVKAFFNRRFTFRLWRILVFLLIIAIIIIVGACILSTRHGPGKLQGMKICSKAAMTKETKENGGSQTTTMPPTICHQKTTSGQCCSIPFTYKGVTYNSCTDVDHHRLWCSLDSQYKGHWENCLLTTTKRTPTVCTQKTTSGQCCSIPFIYKGVSYNSCTDAEHHTLWCSLDNQYNGRWENCVLTTTKITPTVCPQRTTSGQCCIIPFTYKGVTYNSCTDADHHRLWCSLDSQYKGRWDNCHVDKCSNGSHDCHPNATCWADTAGNFTCTCQPGFTGNGRKCYDCSSKHFEKYQDFLTAGAADVEQFTINGSQFLAFANHISDTDGVNTKSFIFKFNYLTEKFSLFQAINTSGARNMKFFTIANKHYLAVANMQTKTTYRVNSVIYQWNGLKFVVFQNVSTKGASRISFFKIGKEYFLAVTNWHDDVTNNVRSVIYKWKNGKFDKFQEIPTVGGYGSAAFLINNETLIAFANKMSCTSAVYKWSGYDFVQWQSIRTYEVRDVISFKMNGHTFLAFANRADGQKPNIYKWNGRQFIKVRPITTYGAVTWHPFDMCGRTFLGVANHQANSVIYQALGSQFVKYQELSTHNAHGMTSFVSSSSSSSSRSGSRSQ